MKTSIIKTIEKETQTLFFFIFFFILFYFLRKTIIFFFIFFEITIFPIIFLIVSWGYQIERFSATNYFLIYAFFTSLPFFRIILFFMNSFFLRFFVFSKLKRLAILFLLLPFFVKLPFYLAHLWLPKAHVEAPTCGSIILASVLLKIGGYGVLRLLLIFKTFSFFVFFIRFFGSILSTLRCCFQSDSKRLIAYSSIAHINFIISCVFLFFRKRKRINVLVMFSHGFISGGIFFIVGLLFYFSLTRLIYFTFFSYKTLIAVFLLLVILFSNFGVPPFISSIREMVLFSFFIKFILTNALLLFFYCIVICYACVFFLVILSHGKHRWNFIFFQNTKDFVVEIFLLLFTLNIFILLIILWFAR